MSLALSDIDFLRGLVAEKSGNVISPRQIYMLEQKLVPIARGVGLNDVVSLVAELRRANNLSLCSQVAEAVTVNETSFFRDVHLFDALQTEIIPELVRKNAERRELRIWCAACSSGQEPYSLAMVIREHFPELSSWNIRILATDLSSAMLEKSSAGEYTQLEVNRGLPAKKLIRFFKRSGAVWQAKDELRNLIEFRKLNLTQPWSGLGDFDFVMIRNVLIYFDQATKVGILTRAQRVLKPHGYLFIGSAETLIGLSVPFRRQEINGTVCYRPE